MTKLGRIYFLRRSDGLIKIGYTARLKDRMSALSKSHGTLEVVRVINGDRHREKRLHAQFARFHQFGEWFRDGEDLRKEIDALPDGTVIELAGSEAERLWLEAEAKIAAEARTIIERLIVNRRQWHGATSEQAMKALAADYGIREWMLKNIFYGRATSISAHAIEVLREALPTDLRRCRDFLLAEVDAVENGKH